MKRLLISGFVAVALLAVATTMRSHSIISADRPTVTTGVALSKKSPATAGVTRLPIEEYEDMSLVFSAPPKH
jgi:transcription initiation factor TFIID subunit TAF12